jgi:hypothetical protein
MDGVVNFLDLAGEIAGGRGDGGDPQGGTVPDGAFVEFGDGQVEAVAKLVLHGAEDLAAVFEGLGVGDIEFDGEFGDGHSLVDEHEVNGHADAEGGEDQAEDDGLAGDAAGLPGSGAEFAGELDVTEDGAKGDDDAERDESYS